jgi:hypothetical protein
MTRIVIATLVVAQSAGGLALGLSAANAVAQAAGPHTAGVERAVSL